MVPSQPAPKGRQTLLPTNDRLSPLRGFSSWGLAARPWGSRPRLKVLRPFGADRPLVFLKGNGIDVTILHWPDEDAHPNTVEYIRNGLIDLVVNIPKNLTQGELKNDYSIRRNAIDFNVPLITNARLAEAFITAFCKLDQEDISIKALGEY